MTVGKFPESVGLACAFLQRVLQIPTPSLRVLNLRSSDSPGQPARSYSEFYRSRHLACTFLAGVPQTEAASLRNIEKTRWSSNVIVYQSLRAELL